MVYAFKLPPELMGKMVEIREKTKISLAQQVRDAVRDYCDIFLAGIPPKAVKQAQEYQIKTKLKFMTVKEAIKGSLRSAEKVYELMRIETKIDRECGWVLHLNGHLDLIEKELVSMGTVNEGYMHPREIFKKAIVNGSSSLIVVHNHPSGDPTPSESDKETSKRLKEVSELIGIPVVDFIIIGSKGYTSFRNEKIGGF